MVSLYQYNGDAIVQLINGDQFQGTFEDGQRSGPGKLIFGTANRKKLELDYIEGTYEKEILEGTVTITYTSGEKMVCEVVNGVQHGPAKLIDSKGNLMQVQTQNIFISNIKFFSSQKSMKILWHICICSAYIH